MRNRATLQAIIHVVAENVTINKNTISIIEIIQVVF